MGETKQTTFCISDSSEWPPPAAITALHTVQLHEAVTWNAFPTVLSELTYVPSTR